MAKKETVHYYCDRCEREVLNNVNDPLYRYRILEGRNLELCNECNDLLATFVEGEAIPAVEKPSENKPDAPADPDPTPTEPESAPDGEGDDASGDSQTETE